MIVDPALAAESYCYLTTIGRVTGKPHTIEIWFALVHRTLYLMAGGHRSDWVLNLRQQPAVRVRLQATAYDATARIVTDACEDAFARGLILDKYTAAYSGDLSTWGRTALPIALDVIA